MEKCYKFIIYEQLQIFNVQIYFTFNIGLARTVEIHTHCLSHH